MRSWTIEQGHIRTDAGVAAEVLDFIAEHGVLSVGMSGGIIGCPHQEGIDYDGERCPGCEFRHGRDRFTGERVR